VCTPDVAAAGTGTTDPLAADGIDPRYSELRRALDINLSAHNVYYVN
jgi:hypothetical protein